MVLINTKKAKKTEDGEGISSLTFQTFNNDEPSGKNVYEKEHKTLKIITFAIGGILTAYTWSLVGAELDIFSEIYEGKDFPFYSVIPSYLQIPFALVMTNFLSYKQYSMKKKMMICMTMVLIFFCTMPIVTLGLAPTWTNMWLSLSMYLGTYIFHATFQALFLTVVSVYESYWTTFYFSLFPITHGLIVGVKGYIVFSGYSNTVDFTVLWIIFICFVVSFMYCFVKLSETEHYKRNLANSYGEKSKVKVLNYKAAFKKVKFQSIGLFLSFFCGFLSFPGIFFSSLPPTLFEPKTYILFLNIIIAVFDFVGRPLGSCRFAKQVTITANSIVLLMSLIMIWIFFTDQVMIHEGISYTIMVFLAFLYFGNGIATTYFMSESSRLSDEEDQDAVGSIMVNSLLGGVAAGNIISSTLATIQRYRYN